MIPAAVNAKCPIGYAITGVSVPSVTSCWSNDGSGSGCSTDTPKTYFNRSTNPDIASWRDMPAPVNPSDFVAICAKVCN